jgi:hypothetical protein
MVNQFSSKIPDKGTPKNKLSAIDGWVGCVSMNNF